MRFSLKIKFFLLIFFAISFALGVNSYIYYKNLVNDYMQQTYDMTQSDLDILTVNIQHQKSLLIQLSDKAIQDDEIKNVLNLISNYENKNDYNTILFDEEKKKLLDKISMYINMTDKLSFGLFDKNGNLIALNRKLDGERVHGIISYEKGEAKFIDYYTNRLISDIPYTFDIQKDNFNKVILMFDKDGFSLKFTKVVYYNDKLIGYLRVKKLYTQENIDKVLENTKDKCAFLVQDMLIGTLLDVKKDDIIKNAHPLHRLGHDLEDLFTDGKYFLHSHYITIFKDKKLYIIASNKKSALDQKIDSLKMQLIFSIIISLVISSLIASLFLQSNIINPLNRLMSGVRNIKDKKYDVLKLKGDDELTEIAHEFNTLTLDLKNSFEEIESSRSFLEDIVDTVPIRIFWKNYNGIYLGANKLFLQDAKLDSKDDLVGKTDFELSWGIFEAKKYRDDDVAIMNEDKSRLQYEETQSNESGKVMTIITSKVPMKNRKGEVIGILGAYEDVTQQREVEDNLKDKEKLLAQQSKMAAMGEMLENIAHQWRQPLSVISTAATGIKMQKELGLSTPDGEIEALDIINNSAQHLSKTIDDFRDFFKSDKTETTFSIKKVYEDAIKLLYSKFKNSDIEVVEDIDDIDMYGLRGELIQVIMNILNNAKDKLENIDEQKKFIFVTIKKIYKESEYIEIKIKDNGGGVPQDIINKVFEPYFTTKHQSQGTGIGLYMSEEIVVKHMKGTLTVENKNYQHENMSYRGAEFIITLPIT